MKRVQSRVFAKLPLLRETLAAFLGALFAGAALVAVVYGILKATGIYNRLEMALNLRADSDYFLYPMRIAAALAIVCFTIGFLMYFHKYNRSKLLSPFSRAFSAVMTETKKSKE